MKQIIFLRHCDNRLSGNEGKIPTDGELNENGLLQAKELKKFISKYDINTIFTSLYKRTIQTASIVNEERNLPSFSEMVFNEYFLRPDGKGVEGTRAGISRTMGKIYSIYDNYDTILIVSHKAIGRTMIRELLNIDYSESEKYFDNYGECLVLRNDYKNGDTKWGIIDKFIPAQYEFRLPS